MPALADDSGLSVDALGGQPGIYSARYSGEGATDAKNNAKLLEALESCDDRRATFVCVLAYVRYAEDPLPLICQGLWRGEILRAARGENGFGYDPLFYIAELDSTSDQLSPEVKNRNSHRGRALRAFVEQWHSSISS